MLYSMPACNSMCLHALVMKNGYTSYDAVNNYCICTYIIVRSKMKQFLDDLHSDKLHSHELDVSDRVTTGSYIVQGLGHYNGGNIKSG